MHKVFISALLVAAYAFSGAKTARAEDPVHVYKDGGTVIKLWDRSCTGKAMELAAAASDEKYHGRFKQITSTFATRESDGELGHQDFSGCWLELNANEADGQEGAIGMIFEDGDSYIASADAFTRDQPR